MNFKSFLSNDLRSAIVIFLVALPLCLGIALASGAPLFSGIIAGIVGGIVAGSLSKSPVSVSGPAAGLTTIVLASIQNLGFPAFLLSVIIAGILQIILGYIRAGSLGNFFPSSVIKGMLAAIGLILILKQIPHAVGYDADFEGDEDFSQNDNHNTFTEIIDSIDFLSPGAITICIISLIVLIVWNTKKLQSYKFFRFVPAALIVVLVGICLSLFFETALPYFIIDDKHMVSVPIIKATSGLSSIITFPDFALLTNLNVYTTAITIALVASLETLLNIEACDKLDPHRRITPLNHELKAQGIANICSGLLGGLPLTSVIVRSSANITAGAKSKASAIAHGIILLLALLLIPSVLKLIPLACLAAILFYIGFKLTRPSLFIEMYKKGIDQFLPFIVTITAILFTDLLKGIFLGILVAIFFILRTNFRESVVFVNDGKNYFLTFTKDVSFLNKGTLRDIFQKIPSNSFIIIDGSQANFIDNDVRDSIQDFIETSTLKNIQVELKNI